MSPPAASSNTAWTSWESRRKHFPRNPNQKSRLKGLQEFFSGEFDIVQNATKKTRREILAMMHWNYCRASIRVT